jgi:hypothetical protein
LPYLESRAYGHPFAGELSLSLTASKTVSLL